MSALHLPAGALKEPKAVPYPPVGKVVPRRAGVRLVVISLHVIHTWTKGEIRCLVDTAAGDIE